MMAGIIENTYHRVPKENRNRKRKLTFHYSFYMKEKNKKNTMRITHQRLA